MNAKEIEKYTEEDYEELLNESYGEINVCGYKYQAGRLLKEVDPIAFRCGYNDSQEYEYECSCGQRYKDKEDAEECCKEEVTK